ncbi:MAG: L-threonylcarbamoyladenylate synthase [Candidatus Jorgensenbacteria bacterium]
MIDKKLIAVIKKGGVGVMPTDTIYGLVGSALLPKTVERIYRLRKRNPKKPVIVLIADLRDLVRFGIKLEPRVKTFLWKIWPGPYSVVLPCPSKKFAYLHRGTETLAVRLPKPQWLRTLLKATGSLVAPSANPQGKLPARTVAEAKKYFGERVDFYVHGAAHDTPSTLLEVKR